MVKLLHIYVDAKSFLAELTLKNVTIIGIYTTYTAKNMSVNMCLKWPISVNICLKLCKSYMD